MPHSTQSRSFWSRSSQPITWLILTNKTVQENTQTNTTQKKQTTQKIAKQNYPGSIVCYDTRPGNETGLFCNLPKSVIGSQVWVNDRSVLLHKLFRRGRWWCRSEICDVMKYCCKELRKDSFHVAQSCEAKKTIKECNVSATSRHHYCNVFTCPRLVQRNCCTSDKTFTVRTVSAPFTKYVI